VLDVFASVVADHHLIGHHERLHEALRADGSPPSAGAVCPIALVLGRGGRAAGGRRAPLAGCAAFNEVCGRTGRRRQVTEPIRKFQMMSSVWRERESVCVRFIRGGDLTPLNLAARAFSLYDPDALGKGDKTVHVGACELPGDDSLLLFLIRPWPKYRNIHPALFPKLVVSQQTQFVWVGVVWMWTWFY